MNRLRRTTAATAAVAALVLTAATPFAAEAKPADKGAKGHGPKTSQVRSGVKQLVNDITVKDRALARVSRSATVVRLADEHEWVLTDAIAFDRDDLAAIRDEALAADASFDARAARVAVRGYRVEIYTQAAGIVREVEKLTVEAAEDPGALAFLDLALESALALTSLSPKADVEVAKQYVDDARAELEDVDDVVVDPVV